MSGVEAILLEAEAAAAEEKARVIRAHLGRTPDADPVAPARRRPKAARPPTRPTMPTDEELNAGDPPPNVASLDDRRVELSARRKGHV